MKDYEELLVALRQISRAIDIHSKQLLRETGLTTSQLLILQSIQKNGHSTPTAIARDIHLSQATVTNVLLRLAQHGLINREKSGGDRRSTRISLTPEGSARVKSAPELLQAGFLREFRKLEPWEANMLTSALQRVASMMNAEDLDASPILVAGEIQDGAA